MFFVYYSILTEFTWNIFLLSFDWKICFSPKYHRWICCSCDSCFWTQLVKSYTNKIWSGESYFVSTLIYTSTYFIFFLFFIYLFIFFFLGCLLWNHTANLSRCAFQTLTKKTLDWLTSNLTWGRNIIMSGMLSENSVLLICSSIQLITFFHLRSLQGYTHVTAATDMLNAVYDCRDPCRIPPLHIMLWMHHSTTSHIFCY